MDAFLRRVLAQRDAEQAIAMNEGANYRPCRLCPSLMRISDAPEATVCGPCGGLRAQERLEAPWREAQRRRQQQAALEIAPTVERVLCPPKKAEVQAMEQAEETARMCCTRPGCGTKLRSDNRSGICNACRKGGAKPAAETEMVGLDKLLPPVPEVPIMTKSDGPGEWARKTTQLIERRAALRHRFEVVVEALGLQEEEAMAQACEAWLKSAAQRIAGAA